MRVHMLDPLTNEERLFRIGQVREALLGNSKERP